MLKNQWEHQEHGVPENPFFIFTIFFGCVTLPQTLQDNVVCPWRMEAAMGPGRFELMSRKELWLVKVMRGKQFWLLKKKNIHLDNFSIQEKPLWTKILRITPVWNVPMQAVKAHLSINCSFAPQSNIKQYKFSLPPHPLPPLYQLINLSWFINQLPGPSCLSAAHVFRPADKDLVESQIRLGIFNLDWSRGLARRCDRKNWRQASCLQKNLWGTGCVFTQGW